MDKHVFNLPSMYHLECCTFTDENYSISQANRLARGKWCCPTQLAPQLTGALAERDSSVSTDTDVSQRLTKINRESQLGSKFNLCFTVRDR
jgi:hypothetical protein